MNMKHTPSKSLKHSMSLYINMSKHPGTKLIMIINVKMPTCVGILTLMSIRNTPSKSLKHSMSFYFNVFKQPRTKLIMVINTKMPT